MGDHRAVRVVVGLARRPPGRRWRAGDRQRAHGTVIPPIPYRLRLDVRLQQCDRPRLIEAAIDGDVRGQAALRLDAAGGGTRAQVAWSLRMHSAPLRVAARVAYPLMRWGHDGVVDMAVAGFRQRALPGTAAQTPRSLIQQPRRAPD
jgi:hypothetical protein